MRISRRDFLFGLLFPIAAALDATAVEFNGVDYLSLPQVAALCGMRYTRLQKGGKTQSVYSKYSRLDFEVNSRAISLNGVKVWLGFPVTAKGANLYIAKRDYAKAIVPILFPQKNEKIANLFHIVIDPGHGGKDNGAMNRAYKLKEKTVALDIAFRLGRELKKNGYKVSFTRTSDTFEDLKDRPRKANNARANLFLSIHCNAANPSVSGIETFAMTPQWSPSTSSPKLSGYDRVQYSGNSNDGWNQLLSYYIQRSLKRATGKPDRGVKRARFAVLKYIKMPAALIECGFISNTSEARALRTPAYRQKIAEAISAAILQYHKTLRRYSH